MGMCQSADELRQTGKNSEWEHQRCPTVFELEVMVEKKRGAAKRLRDNFVHIEFRRGLFEMYRKGRLYGDDICDSSDGDGVGSGSDGVGMDDDSATLGKDTAAAAAKDEGRMFVATHKVSHVFRLFSCCCCVPSLFQKKISALPLFFLLGVSFMELLRVGRPRGAPCVIFISIHVLERCYICTVFGARGVSLTAAVSFLLVFLWLVWVAFPPPHPPPPQRLQQSDIDDTEKVRCLWLDYFCHVVMCA